MSGNEPTLGEVVGAAMGFLAFVFTLSAIAGATDIIEFLLLPFKILAEVTTAIALIFAPILLPAIGVIGVGIALLVYNFHRQYPPTTFARDVPIVVRVPVEDITCSTCGWEEPTGVRTVIGSHDVFAGVPVRAEREGSIEDCWECFERDQPVTAFLEGPDANSSESQEAAA